MFTLWSQELWTRISMLTSVAIAAKHDKDIILYKTAVAALDKLIMFPSAYFVFRPN